MAPESDPIGTRDMHSIPPPIVTSDWPAITCAAAVFTASSPDAQNRLGCFPGTLSGKFAFRTAARAMQEPCSPTGDTQPNTT